MDRMDNNEIPPDRAIQPWRPPNHMRMPREIRESVGAYTVTPPHPRVLFPKLLAMLAVLAVGTFVIAGINRQRTAIQPTDAPVRLYVTQPPPAPASQVQAPGKSAPPLVPIVIGLQQPAQPAQSAEQVNPPKVQESTASTQCVLTPAQNSMAGTPEETPLPLEPLRTPQTHVSCMQQDSVPTRRTLTPAQKAAAGIPYETPPPITSLRSVPQPVPNPPEESQLHQLDAAPSMPPRADTRVPLLPPPPRVAQPQPNR